MARTRANNVAEWVTQLGSRSRARVDTARARLSIVGAEAVEPLLTALEGSDNRIRARVMPLIAAIQDPRGREPLIAMLIDRNARMRLIAARCLARFPSRQSVRALQRTVRARGESCDARASGTANVSSASRAPAGVSE